MPLPARLQSTMRTRQGLTAPPVPALPCCLSFALSSNPPAHPHSLASIPPAHPPTSTSASACAAAATAVRRRQTRRGTGTRGAPAPACRPIRVWHHAIARQTGSAPGRIETPAAGCASQSPYSLAWETIKSSNSCGTRHNTGHCADQFWQSADNGCRCGLAPGRRCIFRSTPASATRHVPPYCHC